AAAGFYRTLMDGTVDLSLEAYYKRVLHYIDYKSGAVLVMNPNLADDLIETENRSYGVELMAKKTLGKLNGWISYTWSRSQLREMEDRGALTVNRGEWYNAAYDKPHDVKVVANYKFTHRYSLSVNLDYSTGRPVTVPIGRYLYSDGYRLVYSDRNSYRIPDYFRLDLAVIVEPGHYLRQLTHLSFTIGCYNVTGRRNPYSIYYTSDGNDVTGHMLSVFAVPVPYVNFNLKF
ncbi:MAG: TonB-dependent receptor, partial [Bacteroidales bacterium]|nr:TonB-dependent receptor [Bacteroidales bacterium]